MDGSGNPVEGASIQADMVDHEFGFGTAVAAHLFAGNSQQNNTYEDYLLDLDGEGHRFNCVVFENATKWRAWEQNWWGVDKDDKVATLELQARGGVAVPQLYPLAHSVHVLRVVLYHHSEIL